MTTQKIQTAIDQSAPSDIKDIAVRTVKTFIASAAGIPLTTAIFSQDVSGIKTIVLSAGIAATNAVMNALLKWASSE